MIQLLKTVMRINNNTRHTCFMDISGHINHVYLNLYVNGWEEGKSSLRMDCKCNDLKNLEEMSNILEVYAADIIIPF